MKKNNRRKKEEISEDWCFVCKEGGLLILCDHKDCLKSYHPHCVGKDASSLDNESWKCGWHFCFICQKAAKFHCFCCPNAVCGRCLADAEFVVVRGIKGFCNNCLRLALLWEEQKDCNADGVKIDFTMRETAEFLFVDYWKIVKQDESLELQHLQKAQTVLMKGNFDDKHEFSVSNEDTLNLTNFEDWEWEKIEDYHPSKREKNSRLKSSKKSTKSTVQAKKVSKNSREFAGWGSKALIVFLASINVDTSVELSHFDVTDIVMRYVNRNKLLHQQRKKMIVCDQSLQDLLGKKMVSKHRMHELLEAHLATNVEDSEENHESSSEEEEAKTFEKDLKTLSPCQRKKKQKPDGMSNGENAMSIGIMAAIIPENLKLVYLKKSLVEELLKNTETFETKVIGSFIRVKADPNDYMHQHSHQLVPVTAVKKQLIEGKDAKILFKVSNMPIDVDIHMLLDSDFTKEDCELLNQQMKDGLHKKLTVVELECKARMLHEDITKHWIVKELALLKNLIDRANEKGWRRELFEYGERRKLLLQPSEQSRLIEEIPQVIAEGIELNVSSSDSQERSELTAIPPCNEPCVLVAAAIQSTTSEEPPHHDTTIFQEKQQRPLSDDISISVEREPQITEYKPHIITQEQQESIDVIDLSDDDEIEIPEWYCMGPLGDVRGPYSMSFLRSWKDVSAGLASRFKVWKRGQSKEDATPLPDACGLVYDTS